MRDEAAEKLDPCASENTTTDALLQGRLKLTQPRRSHGYRFNLDSVLLAGFVGQGPARLAIDLGAGCGVIGALLLAAGKADRLVAVERQPMLVDCLRRNVAQNRLNERWSIIESDLRAVSLPPADLVVFNPPYFEVAAGRPGSCQGRDEGRREVHGALADFVAAAARCLTPEGKVAAIVPYARREQYARSCAAVGLTPLRTRAVHAFASSPPRHALLEAGPSKAAGCKTEPRLIVHETGGTLRSEILAWVNGGPG